MGLTNWYRVIQERPVLDNEQGDEFEHEFTAEEEEHHLRRGALEIIPRAYRVIGASEVAGQKPGEIVDLALTKGQEEALLYGGGLERADEADVPVSELDELDSLKREELNELALARGIEEPEKLPSKKAVVKAIREVVESPATGEEEER